MLPVGAVEAHGPHLPLGTDTYIVDGVLEVLRGMKKGLEDDDEGLRTSVVLPTMAVGASEEHGSFPGTLSLSDETLMNVWMEVCRSVIRIGMRRIVVVNGHGGQTQNVEILCRRLRFEMNVLAFGVHLQRAWNAEKYFPPHELKYVVVVALSFTIGIHDNRTKVFFYPRLSNNRRRRSVSTHLHVMLDPVSFCFRYGIHAGAVETSAMMALHEDLVHVEHLADFSSKAELGDVLPYGDDVMFGWRIEDLNIHAAVGNATLAEKPKGEKLIHHLADMLLHVLTSATKNTLPTQIK